MVGEAQGGHRSKYNMAKGLGENGKRQQGEARRGESGKVQRRTANSAGKQKWRKGRRKADELSSFS